MSIIKGLDVGKRAMMVQAEAVRSAGQNISNASLPGYSRQKIEMKTVVYRSGDQLTALDVRRVRDGFLDRSIRSETQSLGEWEMRSRLYGQIEQVFLEPTDHGLSNTLAQFWNSWEDAANNPENTAPRAIVAQYGTLIAQSINRLETDLKDVRNIANDYIDDRVTKINDTASQIADLNSQILILEASVEEASTIRDRRDLLIEQLSKIIDTTVVERENSMSILIGGRTLVDNGVAFSLETRRQASGDMTVSNIVWADDDANLNIRGGELAGLIGIRDEIIPDILTDIDQVASTLITEVNAIHTTGYGANGSTGLNFFTGSDATDIAVNSELTTNADNVAISETGEPGDTGIARDMAALSDQNIVQGSLSLDEFYANIVGVMGTKAHGATMMMESAEMLVSNLHEQRESVSGVSLDEEAANLIRFQSAYESAAQFISVVDEMVDVLINLV